MRKRTSVLTSLIAAFVVASCGGDSSRGGSEMSTAGFSGRIELDGSSTVFPIAEAVAEEFQIANPDVRVSVGVSGSGGGFKRFCAGEIDITKVDMGKNIWYHTFDMLRPELVALKDANGDAAAFAAKAKTIAETSEFNLVLMSDSAEAMKAAVDVAGFKRPLLYAATEANLEACAEMAKAADLPLVVKADSVEALIPLTEKLTEMGLKDIVIDPGSREIKKALEDQIIIRRAALKNGNRAIGFPTITFPCEMASNLEMETLIASMFIAKYAGIVVLSDFSGDTLFPLLLERLNIYTDPQRPMTVTEGIYEINNPDENSPVMVTTNFALTYFIVSGEIEGSRVPAYLLIKDSEGLSVMTAWAAGKFAGDDVGMFVKKSGIMDKVKHTELIIPGYAAAIAGDVEEELPGWTITVGPREAAHIPGFLKSK